MKRIVNRVRIAPLDGTYMLISIMGFLITIFWLWDMWPSMAAAFILVFVIMFVNSLISMTFAVPPDLEDLAIHNHIHHGRKRLP